MFGNEYDIVREFNAYFLDYQEQYDADTRWTDRIISSSGDWSGNVYDFYFRVYNKLIQDIKVPFKMDGGTRIDDTPVHQALREALANCLVNADYYGRQGSSSKSVTALRCLIRAASASKLMPQRAAVFLIRVMERC